MPPPNYDNYTNPVGVHKNVAVKRLTGEFSRTSHLRKNLDKTKQNNLNLLAIGIPMGLDFVPCGDNDEQWR